MEADKTRDYVIDDTSLVRELNNLDKTKGIIENFIKELKTANNSHPAHLVWLNKFTQVLDKMRQLFEISRIQLSDYNIHFYETFQHLLGERMSSVHLLPEVKTFPTSYANPKFKNGLSDKFSHFSEFIKTIFQKTKSNLPQVSERYRFMIFKNFIDIENAMILTTKDMKTATADLDRDIHKVKTITLNIRRDIDKISVVLTNGKKSAKNAEEISTEITNINGQSFPNTTDHAMHDLAEKVEEHKKHIKSILEQVCSQFEMIPLQLESILSVSPAFLFNKQKTDEIKSNLQKQLTSIVAKANESQLKKEWISNLNGFIEDCEQYLDVFNVEICSLSSNDATEINNLILKKPILANDHGLIVDFREAIASLPKTVTGCVKDPTKLIPDFGFDYVKNIFVDRENLLKNIAQHNETLFKNTIDRYRMKLKEKFESTAMIASVVRTEFNVLTALTDEIRIEIINLVYKIKHFDGETLKRQVTPIATKIIGLVERVLGQMKTRNFQYNAITIAGDDLIEELKLTNKITKTAQAYFIDFLEFKDPHPSNHLKKIATRFLAF